MERQLSSNAQAVVNGSLSLITKLEQLDQIDTIVGRQVGELSLSLTGDAWDRSAHVRNALIEIAIAYVGSLAEQKLKHQA